MYSLQGKKPFFLTLILSTFALFSTRYYSHFPQKIIYFWDESKKDLRNFSVPITKPQVFSRNIFSTKKEWADLNNNSQKEIYILKNGKLKILENLKVIWESPDDWWIDNFFLADSNNDGIVDINLSLWKAGNFGSSKPFWVSENDMSVKNHFFIYDFVNEKVKLIWGSSNLEVPNCEFGFTDIDKDGSNELIVIEGYYAQGIKCKGKYLAIWRWNGWGFSNEWRSEKGEFFNLKIEKGGEKNLFIVNAF